MILTTAPPPPDAGKARVLRRGIGAKTQRGIVFCHAELYKANQNFCHPEFISGSKKFCVSLYPSAKPLGDSASRVSKSEQLSRGIGEACHCEEAKPTSQSQNMQNSTIMRLLLPSRNDGNINNLLTYLPTNLLTSGRRKTKVAFTLAEVLITLTIIGVVAAMTMPSLIAKYQKQSYVTALQKNFSVLSNALQMAQAENGPLDTWSDVWDAESADERMEGFYNKISPYLKVIKNCGLKTNTGCYETGAMYYYLNGSEDNVRSRNPGNYKFVLNDGSIVRFYAAPSNCIENKTDCIKFTVDVNGQKGPNTYGRDDHPFRVYPFTNDIQPAALRKPPYNSETKSWPNVEPIDPESPDNVDQCAVNSTQPYSGMACVVKIINDGYKMDY